MKPIGLIKGLQEAETSFFLIPSFQLPTLHSALAVFFSGHLPATIGGYACAGLAGARQLGRFSHHFSQLLAKAVPATTP